MGWAVCAVEGVAVRDRDELHAALRDAATARLEVMRVELMPPVEVTLEFATRHVTLEPTGESICPLYNARHTWAEVCEPAQPQWDSLRPPCGPHTSGAVVSRREAALADGHGDFMGPHELALFDAQLATLGPYSWSDRAGVAERLPLHVALVAPNANATLTTAGALALLLPATARVRALKRHVAARTGVAVEKQRALLGAEELADDLTVGALFHERGLSRKHAHVTLWLDLPPDGPGSAAAAAGKFMGCDAGYVLQSAGGPFSVAAAAASAAP